MAIQKSYVDTEGNTHANAYHRVVGPWLNHGGMDDLNIANGGFGVEVYADVSKRDKDGDGADQVVLVTYHVNVRGESLQLIFSTKYWELTIGSDDEFYKRCYDFLKTFTDPVDYTSGTTDV